MPRKKLRFSVWRFVVLLSLHLMPIFAILKDITFEQKFLPQLFLSCFGGPYAYPSLAVVPVFLFLTPNLFLLFLFSDFMRVDCIVSYVYVFTRLGNKKRWLFPQTLRLLGMICIVYLILFATVFLLGIACGFSLSIPLLVKLIPLLFCLNVGTSFFFSLLQNFLSLPLGSGTSFFITAFFYAFGCIAALLLYYKGLSSNLFLFVLLPSNQMLLWHDTGLGIASPLLDNPIQGFLPLQSCLVLGGYSLLLYWIFRIFFYRCDMSELLKEAN